MTAKRWISGSLSTAHLELISGPERQRAVGFGGLPAPGERAECEHSCCASEQPSAAPDGSTNTEMGGHDGSIGPPIQPCSETAAGSAYVCNRIQGAKVFTNKGIIYVAERNGQ